MNSSQKRREREEKQKRMGRKLDSTAAKAGGSNPGQDEKRKGNKDVKEARW